MERRTCMKGFIVALNSLNTPWIAILVIVLGMAFDILCKRFGLDSDAATGVIGAGIGLLTGQVIHGAANHLEPEPPAKEQ